MAATALIKLTQNASSPGPGVVLVGVTGDPVTVENDNNVGIASWQIDLVYVGPGSLLVPTVPLAFSNSGDTPTVDFTPDVVGSYRLVLKVWTVVNRIGKPADVDIRNFVVLAPNGLVIPPYQKDPDPLPTLASGLPGAKPNEMNIGGLELGWAGNGVDDGLLNQAIALIGTGGSSGLPPLASSHNLDVLTADSTVPYFNVANTTVYDGTHVWVLKTNVGPAVLGTYEPTSWGLVRLDPVTNKYLEDFDSKDGTQNSVSVDEIDTLDACGTLVWTGTQLFAVGTNLGTGDIFVREVIRGTLPNVPTSLGVRNIVSGFTGLVSGAVWDGSKIWFSTSDGNLVRINPASPTVPETFLAVSSSLSGIAYDPNGAAYPDNKPKIFAARGTNRVFRVTNLDGTPISDANISDSSLQLFLAGNFLFGGSGGALTRFVKQPFAVDFTVSGPNFPIGAVYEPSSGKGFVVHLDDTSNVWTVSRYDLSLNLEISNLLDSKEVGALPFLPCGIAVVAGDIFVATEGVPSFGAGNVFKIDSVSFDFERATSDKRLRYSQKSDRVQFVVDPNSDTDQLTWNEVADVIAVGIVGTVIPITVIVNPGRVGRRLTVVDVNGTADPTNTIEIQASGLPINPVITQAFGSVELECIGVGVWRVVMASGGGGGGGGITPPAGDLGGDTTTPVVVGLELIPFDPATVPADFLTASDKLVWDPGSNSFSFSGFHANQYTADSIAAAQVNDYYPVNSGLTGRNWEFAHLVRLNSDLDAVVTGFSGLGSLYPQKLLVCVSNFSITLMHDDGASAFRILTPDGAPIVMNMDSMVVLTFDDDLNAWRAMTHVPSTRSIHVPVSSPLDDFDFPGFTGAEYVELQPSGNDQWILSGMNSKAIRRRKFLTNNSSTGAITITHEDASSTAENRFSLPDPATETEYVLEQARTVEVVYDDIDERWKILQQREEIFSVSAAIDFGPNSDVELGGFPGARANVILMDVDGESGDTPAISGISVTIGLGMKLGRYLKKVINVSAFDVTFENESPSSLAANRFRIAGGDLVVGPDESVDIFYDPVIQRWRVC